MKVSNLHSNSKSSHQPLNSIAKNKRQSESDFRVHFTLMNVKWKIKDPQKQQQLIEYIFTTLNGLCTVHLVQISSIIDDDTYDVSIGFHNDIEAFKYLRRMNNITLFDGVKQYNNLLPIISRSFQSYMKKMQRDYIEIQPQPQPPPLTHKSSSTGNNQMLRKQSKQDGFELKNNMSEQVLEKRQEIESEQFVEGKYLVSNFRQRYYDSKKDKEVSKILAFGIPKQFSIAEIEHSLHTKGIQTGECKWRHKQHMQYLEIDLVKPMMRSSIYFLGLDIQNYPFITIPLVAETEITRQLSKYTVQIITRARSEEEQRVIMMMKEIGGINVMIRTPIKDKQEYRYVVVFNNIEKAQNGCRIAKQTVECQANRKQYELRVGRVNKYYTFQALIQNHVFS